MDELTKGCIAILAWTAIFCTGLYIAGRVNKPIGIILMLADVIVLYVKMKASCEVTSANKRRRKFERKQWEYIEEMINDDK